MHLQVPSHHKDIFIGCSHKAQVTGIAEDPVFGDIQTNWAIEFLSQALTSPQQTPGTQTDLDYRALRKQKCSLSPECCYTFFPHKPMILEIPSEQLYYTSLSII